MLKFLGENSWKDLLIDLLYAVVGTALVGAPLAVFTIPNDIAPGGVSGLATALAAISPIRVSIWTLMLNIPLLLGAWRLLGRRSLIFTLVCTGLLSLFIDLATFLIPSYTKDMLIASVFGGAISGFGIGVLFLRGLSTGGTDLAALMLKRALPNIPSGTLLLFVDATVVAIAVCIFRDIEVALYSTITIIVSSKVIDMISQGVDYAKVIYIITAKGEEVTNMLNTQTDRGTTIIPALGGYTKQDKQMVVTVTRRNVLSQTLKLIKQTDPAAFTFVTDSTEVHGEGFKMGD